MSQTPITQAQWRAVARSPKRPGERWGHTLNPTPSRFQGDQGGLLAGEANTENRPVEKLSWHDARKFCNRLSQCTGRKYNLPSEAQWEYGCRAGTSTTFHFGATITPALANYDANTTYAHRAKGEYRKQTTPVGMFPANAWGLQDMHGNVWEWCLDPWYDSYQGAPRDDSAWLNSMKPINKAATKGGSANSSEREPRLLRGGSWFIVPGLCGSASRYRLRPGGASFYVGFRVVCLPQGPSLNSSSINLSALAVSSLWLLAVPRTSARGAEGRCWHSAVSGGWQEGASATNHHVPPPITTPPPRNAPAAVRARARSGHRG